MRRRTRARENPLTSGESVALGFGVAAVLGVVGYALFAPTAPAVVAVVTPPGAPPGVPPAVPPAAPPPAARTAGALDNYNLLIVSPTVLVSPVTTTNALALLHSIPGLSAATVAGVSNSADGKSAMITFVAPPGLAAAAQSYLTTLAGATGVVYTLTDTSVNVV